MMKRDEEAPSLVPKTPNSRTRCILAWCVHAFTASGVICCLLALEATYAVQFRTALGWLFVAVLIDALDGTLARLVAVKQVVPNFDGTLLDNLVDFCNYVIVPALIVHRAGLVPTTASFAIACAICLASAYQFCQSDAKTEDHYFKGFPSYWNVVVLYLLSIGLSPELNLGILITLIALVFIPIKYVYPTRTADFRKLTLSLTIPWALIVVGMLYQLPQPQSILIWLSLTYVVYYLGLSLYLTMRSAGTNP